MALSRDVILDLIKEKFPDADCKLQDLAGDQDHYEIIVHSSAFKGLSKISQHKLVHNALGNYVGNEIHALSIKTYSK